MGGRYWITGVQIGMIKALLKERVKPIKVEEILAEIEEKQFIGSVEYCKRTLPHIK